MLRSFVLGLVVMGFTGLRATAEHYVCTRSGRSVDVGWTPKAVEIWEDKVSGTLRSKSDFVHDQAEHQVGAKLGVSNARRKTYSFAHTLLNMSTLPKAWRTKGVDRIAYYLTIRKADFTATIKSKRLGFSRSGSRETGKCIQK